MEAPSCSSLLMAHSCDWNPCLPAPEPTPWILGRAEVCLWDTESVCLLLQSLLCVKTKARKRLCKGTCYPRLPRQQGGLSLRNCHCMASVSDLPGEEPFPEGEDCRRSASCRLRCDWRGEGVWQRVLRTFSLTVLTSWPHRLCHCCGLQHSALGGEMLWGSPIRGNAVVMYKV